MIRSIGKFTYKTSSYLGGLSVLTCQSVVRLFKRPSKRRVSTIMNHIARAGADSLTVVAVIMLLMGMVIAFQTAFQLERFGSAAMVPDLIAISMTRELAPVMAALVVAGRAGAAIAAEIGSMKITEQIDALKLMGADPIEILVFTRLVAFVILMPLLVIYADLVGIFGGYIVCATKMGMSGTTFIHHVFEAIDMSDILMGITKSLYFGAVIALASSYEGLRVRGGASGVGIATMRSVVVSFLLIVFTDFMFTITRYAFS